VKLVMTLLVRDEADVLDAQIAFHLNAGVDFVVATDNRSSDGTSEILERYAREGYARVLREPSEEYRQSEWVTRMARLAATELGADWVINSDADEFWWPRGGSLTEVLSHVPRRYGVVRAVWRTFLPQPEGGGFFAERMTVRLAPEAPINDPASPFRPNAKSIHRADPGIRVRTGNHDLADTSLVPLRSWYPIELLHFPLRRPDQIARKYGAVDVAWRGSHGIEHINRAVEAVREGRLESVLGALGADRAVVERGLEEGLLVEDTRLRDALRTLAGVPSLPGAGEGPPTFVLPRDGAALEFPRPTLVDDARFAVEAAIVAEAGGVRTERRLDELERRIVQLERRGPRALARRLLGRRPPTGRP
jgi:Glycosyl transferase family 2